MKVLNNVVTCFPSAKLTFSSQRLSQDISLLLHEISLSLEISVHESRSLQFLRKKIQDGTSRISALQCITLTPIPPRICWQWMVWFEYIYTNNPNPNPYFVYESLICRRQFWRMEISVDRYGEALPRVPARYPLYTIFDRKGASFVYRSLTNGTPFTYLVLFFTSFNCYKCAVFKMWINHKTKKCSRLFYSHKIQLLILLSIFTDQFDRFPFPFIYSRTCEIPRPLIPKAWKRYWVLLR